MLAGRLSLTLPGGARFTVFYFEAHLACYQLIEITALLEQRLQVIG
jgi:hypothetical protein